MKICNDKQDDGDQHAQLIATAYRAGRQGSTGEAPFTSMFGVRARLPLELDLPVGSECAEQESDSDV